MRFARIFAAISSSYFGETFISNSLANTLNLHEQSNANNCNMLNKNCKLRSMYDIIVIGGGVVGLAVARECADKYNATVLIIEKEDAIAAG